MHQETKTPRKRKQLPRNHIQALQSRLAIIVLHHNTVLNSLAYPHSAHYQSLLLHLFVHLPTKHTSHLHQTQIINLRPHKPITISSNQRPTLPRTLETHIQILTNILRRRARSIDITALRPRLLWTSYKHKVVANQVHHFALAEDIVLLIPRAQEVLFAGAERQRLADGDVVLWHCGEHATGVLTRWCVLIVRGGCVEGEEGVGRCGPAEWLRVVFEFEVRIKDAVPLLRTRGIDLLLGCCHATKSTCHYRIWGGCRRVGEVDRRPIGR
jgi:hypothetical protein